jgi:hypothetical protein
MRNSMVRIALLFTIMISIIGIASAAFETIVTDYNTNSGMIETTVGNLQGPGNPAPGTQPMVYELRYYPPGSLACNSGTGQPVCTFSDSPPDQYSSPNGQFDTPPLSHSETFKPNVAGWWVVALFHGGNPGDAVQSFKVYAPVNVSIPEFSTIAMPIVAVIGLLFFFQHKKKNEE